VNKGGKPVFGGKLELELEPGLLFLLVVLKVFSFFYLARVKRMEVRGKGGGWEGERVERGVQEGEGRGWREEKEETYFDFFNIHTAFSDSNDVLTIFRNNFCQFLKSLVSLKFKISRKKKGKQILARKIQNTWEKKAPRKRFTRKFLPLCLPR
jgi:hypothetical protein